MTAQKTCIACHSPIAEHLIDTNPGQHFYGNPPQWLLSEFYHTLGRFLTVFASIETTIAIKLQNLIAEIIGDTTVFSDEHRQNAQETLSAFVDQQKTAGRQIAQRNTILPLIEGMPLSRYIIKFTELMKIAGSPPEQIAKVRAIYVQMEKITKFRNCLAHNGAAVDLGNKHGWFCTTNFHVKPGPITLKYFQLKTLRAALRDLEVLPSKLDEALHPDAPWLTKNTRPNYDDMDDEMRAYVADLDGPWHFIATDFTTSQDRMAIHGY